MNLEITLKSNYSQSVTYPLSYRGGEAIEKITFDKVLESSVVGNEFEI